MLNVEVCLFTGRYPSTDFDEMQLMQYRAVKYPRTPRVQDSKQHLLVYRGVEYKTRLSDSLDRQSGDHAVLQFPSAASESLAA